MGHKTPHQNQGLLATAPSLAVCVPAAQSVAPLRLRTPKQPAEHCQIRAQKKVWCCGPGVPGNSGLWWEYRFLLPGLHFDREQDSKPWDFAGTLFSDKPIYSRKCEICLTLRTSGTSYQGLSVLTAFHHPRIMRSRRVPEQSGTLEDQATRPSDLQISANVLGIYAHTHTHIYIYICTIYIYII